MSKRDWQISAHAGFIDGRFIVGDGAFLTVENPSDETQVASFRGLSEAQTAQAIAAAREAFDHGPWGRYSSGERAAILRRYVDALIRRSPIFEDIVVAEAGCPRHAPVMGSQVKVPMQHGHEIIDLFLSLREVEDNWLPLSHRVMLDGQSIQSVNRYFPVGVVAAITPYNFPVMTALWKVIPVLVTGNTVILRPSPLTPLSALVFADAAEEAELPAGVLNVVLESGIEGARLMSTDPGVDMVTFTGSSPVGTQVMIQAAPTMKRIQLELGGKSAQIFLPDAVDRAIASAAGVCMGHAGQGCSHGTRLFVPEEAKDAVLKRMAEVVGRIKVGQTEDLATQMGPVISEAQVQRCEHFVKLACEAGGRVVTGGKRPAHLNKGHFFEPTVLDLPDNKNPAAQEEIFGPVVSVIGYRDLDHAVEMANDSPYALSGYVHGADRKVAIEVANRMRTGTVNVNGGMTSAYVSMGGHKMSGVGRERGVEGLRLYQQLGCINVA